MSPVFSKGPNAAKGEGEVWQRERGGGAAMAEEEKGSGGVVFELSHVNREPCMRSLLLVIDTETRLFGEGWLDRAEQSKGV